MCQSQILRLRHFVPALRMTKNRGSRKVKNLVGRGVPAAQLRFGVYGNARIRVGRKNNWGPRRIEDSVGKRSDPDAYEFRRLRLNENPRRAENQWGPHRIRDSVGKRSDPDAYEFRRLRLNENPRRAE